jgi:hypothetical protein
MCDIQQGITLQLTQAQGELILEGLSQRPFRQVYVLIVQLLKQAGSAEVQCVRFVLTQVQLRLVLEVLSEMPYNRVQRLLQVMHAQLQAALQPSPALEASLSGD